MLPPLLRTLVLTASGISLLHTANPCLAISCFNLSQYDTESYLTFPQSRQTFAERKNA